VAEGGGLLNRYRVVKPYRGFESLRLRHSLLYGLGFAYVFGTLVSIPQINPQMGAPGVARNRPETRRSLFRNKWRGILHD
jgi:hypothetical protein